jgi:hypothetical protein
MNNNVIDIVKNAVSSALGTCLVALITWFFKGKYQLNCYAFIPFLVATFLLFFCLYFFKKFRGFKMKYSSSIWLYALQTRALLDEDHGADGVCIGVAGYFYIDRHNTIKEAECYYVYEGKISANPRGCWKSDSLGIAENGLFINFFMDNKLSGSRASVKDEGDYTGIIRIEKKDSASPIFENAEVFKGIFADIISSRSSYFGHFYAEKLKKAHLTKDECEKLIQDNSRKLVEAAK